MEPAERASEEDHEHPSGDSDALLPIVPWTEAHEDILVEWADKAMCYRWLHTKAHTKYSRANTLFTIPVIIMSTITGTANFAQDRFPENIREYATMGIGAINIFAGILTTISQFLKISELNEAHRVAGIAWDKFYRNIKVELAKTPIERSPVIQTLKMAKEEFDRLMETSPAIPDEITLLFEATFTEGENIGDMAEDALSARQRAFLALKKPEICDELVTCKQYVYKEPLAEKAAKGMRASMTEARKVARAEMQHAAVMRVIDSFANARQRAPTREELVTELEDGSIPDDVIAMALDSFNERSGAQDPDDNQIIGPDGV